MQARSTANHNTEHNLEGELQIGANRGCQFEDGGGGVGVPQEKVTLERSLCCSMHLLKPSRLTSSPCSSAINCNHIALMKNDTGTLQENCRKKEKETLDCQA